MSAPLKNQNAAKAESEKPTSFLYMRVFRTDKGAWVKAARRSQTSLTKWAEAILNEASKS